MLHPTSLLPALALAATAVAQVGWALHQPAVRPPNRSDHSITYDIARGVTVLFGGMGSTGPLDDTWEWNGVNWTQRVTLASPPARHGHAFAFDIGRARVVLFGGTGASAIDMSDTWEFDGNDWMQGQTANGPSPRRLARMEYDAARGRIVLFGGGVGATGPTFNDTWEWTGAAWTMRTPATSPSPRWGHGMTYDFAHARIVLLGGGAGGWPQPLMNDTWTWDGATWSQVPVISPTHSTQFGLANDALAEVVVRFGGVSTGAETWLFDHDTWRRDPRPGPAPTTSCSLAHDIVRSRTVLFDFNTWEYDPGTIARWTAYGGGCQGTAGVPSLRPFPASLPIVGTMFLIELHFVPGSVALISIGFSNTQWNGNALPFDLGAIGMTGCTLHASPDFVFFAPIFAGHASLVWTLPNDPSLNGTRFYSQGFVLDPGINPLGATVSNAGAGIIGPF